MIEEMANNPKNRQDWIFDLLKVEKLNWTETFGKYSAEFGKSDKTFDKDWKIANERYNEYIQKENKAKEAASIANAVKSLEIGLKSKTQRLLDLQNQEKMLYEELEKNIMVISSFSFGELIVGHRPLNALERSSIHKTIKEIRSEISKIEGDYAPSKTDLDVNIGDKVPTWLEQFKK